MAANRLRWGVLGAADIARVAVIPAIQASANGEVVALASRDLARATQVAAALGIGRVHGSYAGLLADPGVQAVYVPLPNALHCDWVIRAADAGKAILCEKPLALDAAEAERMARACADRNVPLMEAFMYRFHPQTRRALELVQAGAIGEVREVHAHLSVDLMAQAGAGNIRFHHGLGGGTLLDMGCYTIDLTRRVFGQTPLRVRAWAEIDRGTGVDLAMAAILEYPQARAGLVSTSFRAGGQGRYAIIGSDGVIEVPRGFIPGLGSRAPEGLVVVIDRDGRRREEVFAPVDQYRLMAEAFAAAVLAGAPVPYPPADSVQNMRVLDAVTRAARAGSAEDV